MGQPRVIVVSRQTHSIKMIQGLKCTKPKKSTLHLFKQFFFKTKYTGFSLASKLAKYQAPLVS